MQVVRVGWLARRVVVVFPFAPVVGETKRSIWGCCWRTRAKIWLRSSDGRRRSGDFCGVGVGLGCFVGRGGRDGGCGLTYVVAQVSCGCDFDVMLGSSLILGFGEAVCTRC